MKLLGYELIHIDGDYYGLDVLTDSYINNSNINAYLYIESATLYINNSIINYCLDIASGKVILCENIILGDNFKLAYPQQNIITNDTNIIIKLGFY